MSSGHPEVHAAPRLIGDIGGTNARFALAALNGIAHEQDLRCADYPDLASAIETYLQKVGAAAPVQRPVEAALAIASPLTGDIVRMTNHHWQFSVLETRQRLGFKRLIILNDFTALAMSLTELRAEELVQIAGREAVHNGPMALLGPGTGLGVSGLIPADGGYVPLQGEGGHVTLSAATAREHGVLGVLRQRYSHVSAERVLSGPGLVNLYNALCELADLEPDALDPAEITRRGLAAGDPQCQEVLQLFCAWLGTVAGDLALTLGAVGGVYIGGGIVPRLGAYFVASDFQERFLAKGRYAGYLAPIPVYVIHAQRPALRGLVHAFTTSGPRLEA
jgi:glucokinase